jgi:hypothetical protein
VYEPVEVPRRLLNLLAHLVVAVKVEDIGDEVERVLVVLDFGVEACEVEAVGEVLFVDFAEVFVASGGDELRPKSAWYSSLVPPNKNAIST